MPTKQMLIPLESIPVPESAAATLPPTKPSQPPGAPHLAPPQSWADEEGTAALLLPDAMSLLGSSDPSFGPGPLPAHTGQPMKQQVQQRAQARPGSLKLVMAGLAAIGVLIIVLVGARLMRGEQTPESSIATIAARQQLMDEAMAAVRGGQLDQALATLQRLQGSQPDPAVDLMIASIKQLAKRH